MNSPGPTLEDLEDAKTELARWEEHWANYSGNNPDKFQTDIRNARERVEQLTAALKAGGVLAYSDQELRDQALDRLAPDARKDDVVTFQGERYRRRFTPASKSRSGKVLKWRGYWERIAD